MLGKGSNIEIVDRQAVVEQSTIHPLGLKRFVTIPKAIVWLCKVMCGFAAVKVLSRQIVGYSTTPWSPKNMSIEHSGCRYRSLLLSRISGKQEPGSNHKGAKFQIRVGWGPKF